MISSLWAHNPLSGDAPPNQPPLAIWAPEGKFFAEGLWDLKTGSRTLQNDFFSRSDVVKDLLMNVVFDGNVGGRRIEH